MGLPLAEMVMEDDGEEHCREGKSMSKAVLDLKVQGVHPTIWPLAFSAVQS